MPNFNQICLCSHDCYDVFVRAGRLIEHPGSLFTFNSGRGLFMICHGELSARPRPGHQAAGAVGAGLEAMNTAPARDDERLRSHAAGDDPELIQLGAHRALARDQDVLSEVPLLTHVVVVAVDGSAGSVAGDLPRAG